MGRVTQQKWSPEKPARFNPTFPGLVQYEAERTPIQGSPNPALVDAGLRDGSRTCLADDGGLLDTRRRRTLLPVARCPTRYEEHPMKARSGLHTPPVACFDD